MLIRNRELSWISGLYSQNGKFYQPNRENLGADFNVYCYFFLIFVFLAGIFSWCHKLFRMASCLRRATVLQNKKLQLPPAKLQLLTYILLLQLEWRYSSAICRPVAVRLRRNNYSPGLDRPIRLSWNSAAWHTQHGRRYRCRIEVLR